jgi:hypothetical protein
MFTTGGLTTHCVTVGKVEAKVSAHESSIGHRGVIENQEKIEAHALRLNELEQHVARADERWEEVLRRLASLDQKLVR